MLLATGLLALSMRTQNNAVRSGSMLLWRRFRPTIAVALVLADVFKKMPVRSRAAATRARHADTATTRARPHPQATGA